jgi:hypothetical protein
MSTTRTTASVVAAVVLLLALAGSASAAKKVAVVTNKVRCCVVGVVRATRRGRAPEARRVATPRRDADAADGAATSTTDQQLPPLFKP